MSSSNVQEYGIGLDIKSAIRDLKKFQRIAQQFNKKMRADKQQALAEAKKSAAAETKVIKKALTKQEKDLMKKQAVEAKLRERELKAEAKFNLWKRAQTRKLVDSQLKAHQKLEIKRLLATKGTEQQIRDQYDETLRKFRLNKRKEVAAEKAANKKRIADHKKTAKIRSKLGNAVTMAIQAGAAVLTGGGAMVATGGRQYAEDRANAANSGMDVKEYQEKTYKYSQATNLTKENLTDVFQDTNDRLGSKQFLERNKEGQATGADAGLTDTINAIEAKLGKQLSNSQIDKLFSGSADEVLQKMKATFDGLGMSTKEQTFLFESMASNSWRLVTQLEKNSAAIKQAEDDYKRLGLGIQNTAVVDEVTSKFKRMWGIIEQSPMEAFESFSKAISPETMAMLQVASEKIFQFVSSVGEGFAKLLNTITPTFNKMMAAFDALSPLFNALAEAASGVFKAWLGLIGTAYDTISGVMAVFKALFAGDFTGAAEAFKDTFFGIFTGIFDSLTELLKGIVKALPDFLKPDSLQKWSETETTPSSTTTTPSNSTTPTSATSSTVPTVPQKVTTPPQQTIPTAYKQQSTGGSVGKSSQIVIKNELTGNIYLDSNTVGYQVMQSEAAKSAIDSRVADIRR